MLVVVLTGCQGLYSAAPGPQEVDYWDATSLARAHGYDFQSIFRGCFRRDRAAMHKMFRMSVDVPFDGCTAEEYSDAIARVLRDSGDDFFGACLSAESPQVQLEIHALLLYEFQNPNDDPAVVQGWYRKRFPGSQPD